MTSLPKAIAFDWDGTLVNTLPLIFKANNHLRDVLGYPAWSHDEFLKAIPHSTRDIFPKLYGDRAQEATDLLYEYLGKHHLQELELLDGAQDLIDALMETEIPLVVVSNKRHDNLLKEIDHLGWGKFFSSIVGAGRAERDKPDPAPLHMAMGELPHSVVLDSNVWFIGDMESDMKIAQAAGCSSVLLLNGEDKTDLVEKFNPLHVLQGCADLRQVLQDSIK